MSEPKKQIKKSSPLAIKRINLKNLPPNEAPAPHHYQKLRMNDWPPPELIDNSFFCIFCQLQSSPRSTTPIIAKTHFINRETGETLTPRRAKKYVQYCCNDCVGGLRSSTSSPQLDLEFAPSSPSYSPRDSSEKKGGIIRRRRSITNSPNRSPILMRTTSSTGDSPTSSFRSSPARNSNLRRSKTMDPTQMNFNILKALDKHTVSK